MGRHLENAEGRFWIDQDVCLICASCFEIAPDNIHAYNDVELSYVYKQPKSAEELQLVREAIRVCPVEAIVEDEL